jgi:hypothetical protein
MLRERTPEEMEEMEELIREQERAERYRSVYTNLSLSIIAQKDGTLQ